VQQKVRERGGSAQLLKPDERDAEHDKRDMHRTPSKRSTRKISDRRSNRHASRALVAPRMMLD
jgi:hypothetical protein